MRSSGGCLLIQTRLKELLSYNPETGVFVWNKATQGHASGAVAGGIDRQGYLRIGIDAKLKAAHRLAWLYVFGEDPDGFIDHINGDKADNRIINLRSVGRRVNAENQRTPRSDNSSGFLGVVPTRRADRWCSQITVRGRAKHLGMFSSPQEAHQAYVSAKRVLHEGCTI